MDVGAGRLRLFVALTPEPHVQRALAAAAGPLIAAAGPGVRAVAPAALHLTLRFLGDTAPERIPSVREGLADAAVGGAPIALALVSAGAFPTLARAQVLWFGFAPAPALEALYARVDAACEDAGLGREARPFRAHLTVARVRRGASVDRAAFAAVARELVLPAPFTITTLDLVASTLAPSGARHEAVARWALGGLPR